MTPDLPAGFDADAYPRYYMRYPYEPFKDGTVFIMYTDENKSYGIGRDGNPLWTETSLSIADFTMFTWGRYQIAPGYAMFRLMQLNGG